MEFLFVVTSVVIFALLFWQLRATYTIPRRWRVSGPACGNCAYSYSGQPVCPECGHAMKRAGMVTPRLALMLGPGPRMAIGCLLAMGIVSCGLLLPIGFAIDNHLASLNKNVGIPSAFRESGTLWEFSFVGPASFDTAKVDGSDQVVGTPPFGLTVMQRVQQDTAGSVRGTVARCEILIVLRPESARLYAAPASASVFSVPPQFPYLRLNIVNRSVEVFDASGARTAQYATIDQRAFDKLVSVAGIDRSDQAIEKAVQMAATVYMAIADSAPLSDTVMSRMDEKWQAPSSTVRVFRSGGATMNLPPPPPALLQPRVVSASPWPMILLPVHIAAGIFAYRWILRRRHAIMEAGAVYASAPAAS